MLAKHQRHSCRRFPLESRSYLLYTVAAVESLGKRIHHIAAIIQLFFGIRMRGLLPLPALLRIGDAACLKQALHSPAAQVRKSGCGDKPVFGKTDGNLTGFERRGAQLAQLRLQVLGLRCACPFFFPFQHHAHPCPVFIGKVEGEAGRICFQTHVHRYLPYGGLLLHHALELLVEIAVQHCFRTYAARHFQREQLIAFHTVYPETVQLALSVEVTQSVSIGEGLHARHGQAVAPYFFHRAYLFAQRFRSIQVEDARIASVGEIVGKPAAETLVQLGTESQMHRAR